MLRVKCQKMGVEFLNEEFFRDAVFHPLFKFIPPVSLLCFYKNAKTSKGDFFMQRSSNLKKYVYTALIIAIVLALRNFSYMISFGGGAGLRLSLSGFFSAVPAILFGPFFGGLTYGISDVLGYLIRPEGAYIFPLTLAEILKGIMIGYLYKLIKNVNSSKMKIFFLTFSIILGIAGIFNFITITYIPGFYISKLLISLGKRTAFFTVGFLAISVVFIVLFALDYIFVKISKGKLKNEFIKLLVVLLISNITVTTINTFILMIFTPSLSKLGFLVFYTPRLIEEIILTVIQSFILPYLLKQIR